MAEIQDSSGIPSTGQLTPQQQARLRRQEARVFAIATQAAAQQIAATSRTLGRSDERVQMELRDMKNQISTLRAEMTELRKYMQDLRVLFQETEQWREDILKATTAAKADVQTISRTIDRQNWTIEFVSVLVAPLDAVHAWLTKLLAQAHKLDQRDYSQKDGQEITGLVERRKR